MDKETLNQLSMDYFFWKSRYYYSKTLKKFLANELGYDEFICQMLFPILSDRNEGLDLQDHYKQKLIEFDPKSFQFSEVLFKLVPDLEDFEFDSDPSQDIINKKRLRDSASLTLKYIKDYID